MDSTSSPVQGFFSEEDLAALAAATREAEKRTSGEIVPYIVGRVDSHGEARWAGALYGALSLSLLAGLWHWLGGFWSGFGIIWITLPTLVGAGLGALAAGLGPLGRLLVPDEDLERRVRLRAEAAFLEEEVWKTKHRTGILIFLALWEHRAVILGDEGIHKAVPAGTWDRLVDDLVGGIRQGRARQALVEVIGRCGELLDVPGLVLLPDDEDELADAPRVREN